MISIVIIHTMKDFLLLKGEWDAFVDSLDNALILFTHDWLRIGIESYFPDVPLYIMVMYENNRIVGILPLFREEYRSLGLIKRVSLHSFTKDTPVMSGLIASLPRSAEICAAIYAHLRKEVHSFSDIVFEMVPSDQVNVPAMNAQFNQGRLMTDLKPWSGSYYVDTSGNYEEYIHSLSASFKKGLRRKASLLSKCSDVRWEFSQGYNEERFQDFLRIENTGWKQTSGWPIIASTQKTSFYKRIAETFGARQQFFFLTLLIQGRPVVIFYVVTYKGICHAIKLGVDYTDDSHLNFSPGVVGVQELIRYCCTHHIRQLDFYGEFYENQACWTNKINRKYDMIVMKRSDLFKRACVFLRETSGKVTGS